MSTVLAVDDIFVVRPWCTANEQASVNSFYYNVTALGLGGCTDQDIANEIDALLSPLYQAVLTTSNTYNGVQVQIVANAAGGFLPASVFSTGGSGPGLVAGATLPRQTCALTSWKTFFAGQAFRGRTYWPFPPTSFDTGDGTMTGGALAFYQALANQVNAYNINIATGCQFQLSLYHRGNPHAVPPVPPSVTLIVFNTTAQTWATQRRRGSYGRANKSPI